MIDDFFPENEGTLVQTQLTDIDPNLPTSSELAYRLTNEVVTPKTVPPPPQNVLTSQPLCAKITSEHPPLIARCPLRTFSRSTSPLFDIFDNKLSRLGGLPFYPKVPFVFPCASASFVKKKLHLNQRPILHSLQGTNRPERIADDEKDRLADQHGPGRGGG